MDNLKIYEAVRTVPSEAKKPIQGGRLKGKTEINPMWRIKELTNQFGPCGIGWKYVVTNKWMEPAANGEIAAFVDINLYYKHEGEWSEPIPGTGGSMYAAIEKGSLYINDECYKMALTDAISVACKALGFGADVYWDADSSKYDRPTETPPPAIMCSCCKNEIVQKKNKGKLYLPQDIADIAMETYGACLCWDCMGKRKKAAAAEAAAAEAAAAETDAQAVPEAAPEGEIT